MYLVFPLYRYDPPSADQQIAGQRWRATEESHLLQISPPPPHASVSAFMTYCLHHSSQQSIQEVFIFLHPTTHGTNLGRWVWSILTATVGNVACPRNCPAAAAYPKPLDGALM